MTTERAIEIIQNTFGGEISRIEEKKLEEMTPAESASILQLINKYGGLVLVPGVDPKASVIGAIILGK